MKKKNEKKRRRRRNFTQQRKRNGKKEARRDEMNVCAILTASMFYECMDKTRGNESSLNQFV